VVDAGIDVAMREETPREALSQFRLWGQAGNRSTSKEAQSSREDEAQVATLGWTVDGEIPLDPAEMPRPQRERTTNTSATRLLTTLRGAANFMGGSASQGAQRVLELEPS